LVQPCHAAAVGEADRIDRIMRSGTDHEGGQSHMLAGVPFSVKECFPVRGLVTTLGIPSRRHCLDAADALLVERMRMAGAIVVGKANVPQALYLYETDNPVWGRTNHPQAEGRGPGGSSGGDACLVAAGVVPLAVANDLAGSIRQPAHACGLRESCPGRRRWAMAVAFARCPNSQPCSLVRVFWHGMWPTWSGRFLPLVSLRHCRHGCRFLP
jgi:Asp-tRNA(Asn)/Glu-tRNA(Gln) amidotransferase A subunit family amidase